MFFYRLLRPGRGQRAQSTIEFALAAPIFFFIFFSIINGGLLLFSRNALQHAVDVGAAEIAAEGNGTEVQGTNTLDADQLAIQLMEPAGLNNTVLSTVTSISVQREDQVSGSSGENLVLDTDGCGSGVPCEMIYTHTGVTGTDPTGWSCTGTVNTTCSWPAEDRITSQSSGLVGTPDFALVKVDYTFSTIGGWATFHLTASVVCRLEPQSL
ncbi:MAG: TadE/TadG family type IV pilus assembly protein [Candidatus Dormiibacterota bacterium]